MTLVQLKACGVCHGDLRWDVIQEDWRCWQCGRPEDPVVSAWRIVEARQGAK